MRIVVIGATGNIGTSVVRAFADDAQVEQVIGVARRLPDLYVPKTTFVAADVRTSALEPLLDGADVLVQLAWAFQPTHHPLRTWEVNVLGTMRALQAAANAGTPTILYASSVGAYSPAPGDTVDESWPTHSLPTAAYGREKAYLERVLDTFELHHPEIRVARVRPSFVFKREAASEQARVFAGPLLPRWVARPGALPAIPLPTGLRFQAVHAADLAEAFRLLAHSPDARGAYNVASEPIIDRAIIGELLGTRTVPVPQRLARWAVAAAWRAHLSRSDAELLRLFLSLPTLDTTRIRGELGWTPRHSGPAALAELFEGMAAGAGAPTAPLHEPSNPVTVG